MPQSAEHLAAVDALGIRHGLLVVTKSDLADPAGARDEALGMIAATSLGEVPAVAVSAATGQGLPDLIAALDQLASGLPGPDPGAPVRLWVDRAFSIRGSGTVVTGTLAAGTITERQELLLAPAHGTGPGTWPGVARETGPPGDRGGPGGGQPARRRPRPARPGHGPGPAGPLDGDQRARRAAGCGGGRPARRRSSPCTSARRGRSPGCVRWAAGSPGSPCPARCRCTSATGCCCATRARPPGTSHRPAGLAGRAGCHGAGRQPARVRPARCGRRGRPRTGQLARPSPARPSCCGGTGCCAAARCGRWGCRTDPRRWPATGSPTPATGRSCGGGWPGRCRRTPPGSRSRRACRWRRPGPSWACPPGSWSRRWPGRR